MLTIYRSNRAEFLVDVLGHQLRLQPPPPLQEVQVVVNTWPTSRWLGEQLALRLGGIVAHLRCPFPATHLSAIVDGLLDPPAEDGPDPWRASRLVWPLLEQLPRIAAGDDGEPLRRWLAPRGGSSSLELGTWQLGRSIADAFDDYALYRPELLTAWDAGRMVDALGAPLPASQRWQVALYGALRQQLAREPFALRAERAILRLQQGAHLPGELVARLGGALRLFGLSSLAPLQVRLLQALSGSLPVDLYLLTPCGDLWQRCRQRRSDLRDALALRQPLEGEWLAQAPPLEARFGRLGAEFQQLLEGTGEAQLAETRDNELFFAPARVAEESGADPPPLLTQLQEQLVSPELRPQLHLAPGDRSLEFHPCPGPLRQVQIVRDRLLQLLADDDRLEPRDILVMTPEVETYAPLIAAVFSDSEATGVSLPWRLTDRSQQAETGLSRTLLTLLELAGERLTASGLERLLACPPLRRRFELDEREIARLNRELQRLGFRWGLDAGERGGDGTHSLSWAMDRLLLSLVLAPIPGLAIGPGAPAAPAEAQLPIDLVGRWLHLLQRVRFWLRRLGRGQDGGDWLDLLRELVADLFGDGPETAAELPELLAALDEGLSPLEEWPQLLEAPVVAAVLQEVLSADSGRFGHRSGALTISALEPMRAIPHKVIVLMGLEASSFPRQRLRPGFHLMGRQRLLGDADPADQDRYILLEALLSARQHLLLSWSCRDERTGEALPPAPPVRHWIDWLKGALGEEVEGLVVPHAASPLERSNFLPRAGRPPASCDRRLLQARQALERGALEPPRGLALMDTAPAEAGDGSGAELAHPPSQGQDQGDTIVPAAAPPPRLADAGQGDGASSQPCGIDQPEGLESLRRWLMHPQTDWLLRQGIRAREWQERSGDLEALELEERDRASLLRERQLRLEEEAAQTPMAPQDWLRWQRARGRLPARAAGVLEAEGLERRWCSLQSTLEEQGEAWARPVRWQAWRMDAQGRGEALVLVHAGRESIAQRLSLWLDLLLASAGELPVGRPSRGVLISRGERDSFGVTTTLLAPDPEEAAERLAQLAGLQSRWLERCWPVPPRTGWCWLEAERKRAGSGALAAAETWEGGVQLGGEREREEMVVCFGAQLPAADLLKPPFGDCAEALFAPLLAAIEPRRTAGGRRP